MEAYNTKQSAIKQLDNFFYSKKPSEQRIMYYMGFALVAYLIYQFVILQVEEKRESAYKRVVSMRVEVDQKNSFLSINSPQKLATLRYGLAQKQKEYEDSIYKISYVDNTLSELSYLLFNDENWAKFVDNISYLAKSYGLKIQKIKNKFFEPTFQKVSQVVNIEVETKSNYKSMMKFLNKLEESKLVVDVSDINISQPGDKLKSYFKISVWGMKY